jgi:hypothetical protein
MKKIIGIVLGITFVWILGVELILDNTATLMNKAKTMPALTTVDTISKLVVLDSIEKTGLSDRYSYSLEDLQQLFQQNEVTLQDKSYTYFYCSQKSSPQNPQPSMIAAALHKTDKNVVAKGTNIFLEKIPDIESLENSQRNASMLASVLQINKRQGNCIEIHEN